MDNQNYVPVYGVILDIAPGDCQECQSMISLNTENGPVNFVITPDTVIFNNMTLRIGMHVVIFYNATLPVPLIYPPQYLAMFVVPWFADEEVFVDYFDEDLTASSGGLKLNLSPETIIVDVNGNPYQGNPADNILIVYYTTTTRSIPPQTTPISVIVVK